jgi:hypothetical protein
LTVKFRCILFLALLRLYFVIFTLHIVLFLHFLSTNHKCSQPCYFPLLLKRATQKVKMEWNSSMKSSRLALPQLFPYGLWSLPLFFFTRVCVCGINDLGDTCNEYSILFTKSGMTKVVSELRQP